MSDVHILKIRPPVWAILFVIVAGGFFYLGGKWIDAADHTPTTISVSGEGKVFGAPDIASLSLGMTTGRKATSTDAMASLSKTMNAVLAAVKAAGVEDKDISTEQLSLNPSYDYTNGQQVLKGYEATQSLTVKVHNLDKVSTVLGAATSAGANQAGNVDFQIDNMDKIRSQAREQAIAQARGKAQTLAQDLGMRLGSIKGFTEDNGVTPPMPYAAKAMDSAVGVGGGPVAVATPVPSGQQEVLSDVTITYDLK